MKNKITSNKNLKKANGLVKNTKKQKKETSNKTKKLGMGLSSLLSKDQELVSVIKTKVKEKVSNPSSLKIQMPKLSKRDGNMLSISNIKLKDSHDQKKIPIQSLVSGKFQPRKTFDQTELEELAESIKSNGVLQPILVRPVANQSSSFEIIAGERRWRASQIAKLHEVPVIIREFDDETSIGVAMIENLQRSDLNLIEEAQGYRTMMNVFQYTQEKLSSHLGKSRSHIANVLRVLTLPQSVRKYIISGEITFGHARTLVTLPDDVAIEIAQDVLSKGLSVRATEKVVNRIKTLEKKQSLGFKEQNQNKNPNIEHLERELTNLLGLKVVVSHKNNNSGTLSIHYRTLDQIQPVIDKLKWRPK